jgi:hypothetical protein
VVTENPYNATQFFWRSLARFFETEMDRGENMELAAAAVEDREDNLMHAGPYVKRDRRKIHLDLNETIVRFPSESKNEIASALDSLHEYPIRLEAEVIEDVAK